MNTFEVYIHGNPYGQQIAGSEKNREYVRKFYSYSRDASRRKEKAILVIEKCAGDVYYTYLRPYGICDSQGRPNAFFGLTLSFNKAYCSRVYKLFQILEAVYEQVCLNSILEISGNVEKYLVGDFESAQKDNKSTVDVILDVLNHKIPELLAQYIQSVSKTNDTYDITSKVISLMDVDSPVFMEYFEKYSIIVSPNLQSASIAYEAVARQKDVLTTENAKLQSEISSLTSEMMSLKKNINSAHVNSPRHSQDKKNLKEDLERISEERDRLRDKIDEAEKSIKIIEEPFQKLIQLLSGRFLEKSERFHKNIDIESKEDSSVYSTQLWPEWANRILLGLVFILCCVILVVVLRNGKGQPVNKDAVAMETSDSIAKVNQNNGHSLAQSSNSNSGLSEESAEYDLWENCYINIKGGDENLILGRSYGVEMVRFQNGSIVKDENGHNIIAHVPDGKWTLKIGDVDIPIDANSAYFTIDRESYKDKQVIISYVVNDQPVKNLTCTVREK